MPLQKFSDKALICMTCGHLKHHIFETVLLRVDLNAVEAQEDQSGQGAGALVAVYERVVAYNMEKMSGGHLEKIGVQEASTERGRRHGESRQQKSHVANAGRSPIAINLVSVNLEYFGKVEELGIHRLIRQSSEGAPVFSIGRLQGFLKLFPALFVPKG